MSILSVYIRRPTHIKSGKKNPSNYVSIETLKASTHWEEERREVATKVGGAPCFQEADQNDFLSKPRREQRTSWRDGTVQDGFANA